MSEYKVEMTPLISKTEYGSTVDVTDYISSLPSIKKEVDQGDFDIGIFNYGSVSLTFDNQSGEFNEPSMDGRSIFPYSRDNAKIEIIYIDDTGSEYTSFKGIVADRATKQNFNNQTVSVTSLSYDSVFDKTVIPPEFIKDDVRFSNALESILLLPRISNLLVYNSGNIDLQNDFNIDDGSNFDDITAKSAIDSILRAANSVLVIDDNDNIIIRSRDENSNTPHDLYLFDQFGRDNILSIDNYNNGQQRLFNYVVVGGQSQKNEPSIDLYDERIYSLSLDFITDTLSLRSIAKSILDEFGVPRMELTLTIDIDDFFAMSIFDKVTVDVKKSIVSRDEKAPLYEYADFDIDYFPGDQSGIYISGSKVFKVIGFEEIPNSYSAKIKLRDTGEVV